MAKPKTKQYTRSRMDSGHHRRILIAMAVLGAAAFLPVGWRLYDLMVGQFDHYSRKALSNQTRSTTVMGERGVIYDRNMNILASNVSVENVYLDPHELKQAKEDVEDISRFLAEALDKDPAWILEQAQDTRQRYKQVGARVEEDTAEVIRDYINENEISGIHLEPASRRYYPYGTLAAQVIGFTNASGQGSEGVEAAYNSFLEGSAGKVITTKGNNEMDMPFSYENFLSADPGCTVVSSVRIRLSPGREATKFS